MAFFFEDEAGECRIGVDRATSHIDRQLLYRSLQRLCYAIQGPIGFAAGESLFEIVAMLIGLIQSNSSDRIDEEQSEYGTKRERLGA